MRLPTDADFGSRLRSAAVTARVGVWLGVCFGTCFLTGLLSHYAQNVDQPLAFPPSPIWGYRVTQGLHVISGTAAVPLLLVKLWTVYPRLFRRPERGWRRLSLDLAERGSIAVLVAAAVFELATGLVNITTWYPWDFSFRTSHYAVAWIVTGSIVLHVAVKLPVARGALRADVDDTTWDRPAAVVPGALSRRGLLRTTWLASGVAVLATAGVTVPFLRRVSVLGVRSGDGPQGLPINRAASEAGVTASATRTGYRLEVVHGEQVVSLARTDLLELPQATHDLPIACVEGWSASGSWTGVPVRRLLDLVDAPADCDVVVSSLQETGAYSTTVLQGSFTDDERTLLALALNGEALSLDHGYPARIIAPDRPGVLQTKWVARIAVSS